MRCLTPVGWVPNAKTISAKETGGQRAKMRVMILRDSMGSSVVTRF
jgi:hypothetical protein